VQVPDLEGRLFDDAQAQLQALKLVAGRADVIIADRDPGIVIEQRTRPGRYVPQGAEIDLVVSKAAPADDGAAEEMNEMRTIEGKVDRLQADVDAKLGHVEKSLNNLADKIAAQGKGAAPGADANLGGVKPKV
jgi:beta-lactam-binding protein with PASTA domain